MLKILSIKSAELRKGIVGVDGSRKENNDRVELVGRDDIDNSEVRDNKLGKK